MIWENFEHFKELPQYTYITSHRTSKIHVAKQRMGGFIVMNKIVEKIKTANKNVDQGFIHFKQLQMDTFLLKNR